MQQDVPAPQEKSSSRVGTPALRASEEGILLWEDSQLVSIFYRLCIIGQMWGLMASGISFSASQTLLDVTVSWGTDKTRAE